MRKDNMSDSKYAAKERIKDLIILQKQLSDFFPENKYNVFVFGSYPTVRFEEGRSDVDIAVYTDNFELYKKISAVIENFFVEKSMDIDLFFIDIDTPAPIYLAPLHAQIQFTDYYPPQLKAFEQKCYKELDKIKRSIVI